MISSEIRKKIKQIQIKTRRVLNGFLVGDYSTAKKGSGFEFDQIRPYEQGDDVRFIDWKGSARSNKLLFKQYLEDRNRSIVICLDVSSSLLFSSTKTSKFEILAQVAAVLGVVGEHEKDRIGLILFSDKVEKFINLGLGSVHLQKIINAIFEFKIQKNVSTDINVALQHIIKFNLNNSIIFLISDFISDKSFEKNLKIVSQRSDLVAVRCLDKIEKKLPSVGILNLVDLEDGSDLTIKTDSQYLNNVQQNFIDEQNKILKKAKIDILDLNLKTDFIPDVVKFFKRRLMY